METIKVARAIGGLNLAPEKDDKNFAKTAEEAATDLTTLLIELFNKDEKLQKSSLFIVAESYGCKFWIICPPFKAFSRLDDNGLKKSSR
ncbi:hypothetical protein MTR_3g114620 [Medicago truncatula]|uniref:Uncharacterized protein n=1 Tax=Medicago truncatula TaxID=3880 RepID=G7J5V7_MEDTR|nr:hypothetical protein MTR_3g114620 [Medicago truncatula]